MRLVDADALMQTYAKFVAPSNNSDFENEPTWNDAVSLLESAPTVDPIKHGHWISCDDDGDSPYKCSVCGGMKVNENGEWLDICHQEWSKMPYCAVCGAKMDVEDHE